MKNKNKVLIIGAAGMAGHMIYYYLKDLKQYDLFTTVHHTKLNDESIICDVRDEKQLENIMQMIKPDFIINAVGALIKESINNPANAILLNSWLPHTLSKLAFKHQSKLIHISTDCVFSGKKGNYSVDDFKDADDDYGRSKALGELINDRDITIRTSIIGPELKTNGEGLLHWFFTTDSELYGFTNVYWSGITTYELAKIISHFLCEFNTGIYNVAPTNPISKHELLVLVNNKFSLGKRMIPDSSKISNKALISNLDKTFVLPNYETMLDELFLFMKENKELYNFYNLRK